SRRSLSLWCPIPELRATGRRPELAVGIPRRCARLWRFNPESTGVEVNTCPIFMRLKESHTLTAKPRAARQRQELAGWPSARFLSAEQLVDAAEKFRLWPRPLGRPTRHRARSRAPVRRGPPGSSAPGRERQGLLPIREDAGSVSGQGLP